MENPSHSKIRRNKVHYTDIILHVTDLVIIPYSIDNHARSGICEGQGWAMRENNPWMYATDSRTGRERGKVCTFHECMLEDKPQNCAHGVGKGEKQLGEKWPRGSKRKEAKRRQSKRRELLWALLPAPESMVSYRGDEDVLLVEQRI